jgi:hypothetical protein
MKVYSLCQGFFIKIKFESHNKLIFLSAWKILYKEQHKIIIDKGNDYGADTNIN